MSKKTPEKPTKPPRKKRKTGPKPRVFTQEEKDLAFELASIACTMEEISRCLKCCQDSLERRPEMMEIINAGRAEGKASLRRAQMALAMKGNATAQIWVGKNWLGQRDKPFEDTQGISPDELLEKIQKAAETMAWSVPGGPAPAAAPEPVSEDEEAEDAD